MEPSSLLTLSAVYDLVTEARSQERSFEALRSEPIAPLATARRLPMLGLPERLPLPLLRTLSESLSEDGKCSLSGETLPLPLR
jgi:hypothetical protein